MVEGRTDTTSATACRPGGAGRGLALRAGAALGVVLVAFLMLGGRLSQIQIVEADAYRALAERQQLVKRQLAARRGSIYDREGRLLAATVRRWSVFADPSAIEHPAETADLLGRTLDLSAARIEKRLLKDGQFVWIKRLMPDAQAEAIRTMGIKGVHLRKESKRAYPQGRAAAHVVGFTNVDGKGLGGIEARLDSVLRGRPGMEQVLCDGGRRIIRSQRPRYRKLAFDGYDVYLTLDIEVQNIAEEELARGVEKHAPERATVVVMDVRDGSILAMASWPTYDPQAPAATPMGYQRNVAVSDAYEPGSAFKPVAISMALDRGVVTPDTEFDCHQGLWRIKSRTIHDTHPYGMLPVTEIITRSSNIGAAQVGMALGAADLYAGVHAFGFGRPTGIALPGEAGGMVRPLRVWNGYSVQSIPFGQELSVTPLSMVRAFAALANGGLLLQPRIIESIRHADTGEVVYTADGPVVNARPISAKTAEQVLQMIRRVVTHGTGRNVKNCEYPLAGKTGTAQLIKEDGSGYGEGRYMSSFVAVGPVPDPRIAVIASFRAPSKGGYYGSQVAAPVVGGIADRVLRHMRVPVPQPEPMEVALGD